MRTKVKFLVEYVIDHRDGDCVGYRAAVNDCGVTIGKKWEYAANDVVMSRMACVGCELVSSEIIQKQSDECAQERVVDHEVALIVNEPTFRPTLPVVISKLIDDVIREEYLSKLREYVESRVRFFYSEKVRKEDTTNTLPCYIFPELLAQDIVGVQPMTGPVGSTLPLHTSYGVNDNGGDDHV